MSRQTYHYLPHPGRARRPFGRLLVLLCAALLVSAGVAIMVLVVVVLLMLAGVGAFTVARHLHRRRRVSRGKHPAMAPSRPPSSVPGPQRVSGWRATRAHFTQLRSEYGQFECDPLAVLRLPALADVTVASTGRFVDAFAEAQALDTDTEPPAAHQARFANAVD